MTLLISMLAEDEIAVVMDTYGTNAPAGTHFTKCWAARGGKFIVAGTGTAQVVAPWLAAVAGSPHRPVAAAIEEAERMLPELWRQFSDEAGEGQLGPSTAWTYFFDHYGRPTRISVSSRTNFSRETETRTGLLVIPGVPLGQFAGCAGSDAELLRMARHVASYCSEQPEKVDNVAVGGEAVVIRLSVFGGAVARPLGSLS